MDALIELILLAIVAAIALAIAIPLLVLWVIGSFLWTYRKEIVGAIWQTHLALGRWSVMLVRDWPVREFWQDEYSDRAVRVAIVLWLTAVPVVLTITGLLVIGLAWTAVFNSLPLLVGLYLALPSVVAILYGYYYYYLEGPLTHHHLTRFLKEQYLMVAEAQLAWVDFSTRVRLWFLERVG